MSVTVGVRATEDIDSKTCITHNGLRKGEVVDMPKEHAERLKKAGKVDILTEPERAQLRKKAETATKK